MAPFFKKRLRCFYCGRNSGKTQKSAIYQWQCGECQAVNHLDENGEITDPPAIETSPQTRPPQYAQPLSRPYEPKQQTSDSSIFCATCLKNQYLFTQTLASYLPPPSHPDYEAYEASYPSYKKSLEERYPQVCEKCESRVIDRIRQTGYEAKADHLRRMMERSRGGRSKRNRRVWKWKSLWVSMGAMAFWTSVAGQLVWDLMESMASDSSSFDDDKIDTVLLPSLFRRCFSQCLKTGQITGQCAASFQPYAGMSLVLGVLSLWWNPKLRNKVDGYHGRIVGLREYYRIQIVVLMARFIAWAGLQDPTMVNQHAKLLPVIHMSMGIFTIISIIASRATIRFDKKPLVNWHDNTETLLRNSQPRASKQLVSPSNSQSPLSTQEPTFPRFPVANLAPHRPASPEPYIPPTPPPDQLDDVDAMDWTPSQKTIDLKPSSSFNQSQDISTSSPFQGHLPPAPKPPSWQLRNPDHVQITGAAGTKPNPFHKAPVLHPTSMANDEDQSKAKSTGIVMAPPKFFPPSDLTADTGLEHLFDKTFSIEDGPSENQMRQSLGVGGLRQSPTNSNSMPLHILKGTLLFVSMVLWAGTQLYTLPTNSIENVVLGISFLVAGFSLLESLMKPMMIWNVTDILLSLSELVIAVYIAMVRTHGLDAYQNMDNVGIYLAAFMMGQELFVFRPLGDARQKPVSARDAPTPKKEKQVEVPLPKANKSNAISETQSSLQNEHRPATYNKTHTNYDQSTSFNMNRDRNTFFNSHDQNRQPQLTPTAITTYQNTSFGDQRTQPPPLSFTSSLNSVLPENVLSPGSPGSISTQSYASSMASEPQTPIGTPRLSAASLGAPSPSIIKGLSLEDRPLRQTARYPLRNRRT